MHEDVHAARRAFDSRRTRSVRWRRAQLDALIRMIGENEAEWERALAADLGKSADETHLTELGIVLAEARRARRSLGRWSRPRPVAVPWEVLPAAAWVRPEPYGTALVIAPWNYPVQLLLAPIIGALAAGCAVVAKPSELAPETAELAARLAPRYLDREAVRLVTGGADVAGALLDEPFDIIFYTGGERVGRIVAEKAARHLTPTILELGGACPVWVDRTADIRAAARRLAWAKFLNAGQTCVAPNHIFVDAPVRDAFVRELQFAIRAQLGEDPSASPDYGRIVNGGHVERIRPLLADGEVLTGGEVSTAERYIAPTVLDRVSADAPSVREEIFGPVLPIVTVDGLDRFLDIQRDRPKPLAAYGFARSKRVLDRIERTTSSGAFGRNVAVVHLQVPGLPFGGVGTSGYGAYHGKRSFDAFTHDKAVLAKPTFPDTLRLIIPPLSGWRRALIRRLIAR